MGYIAVDRAYLVGFIVEAVLYGLYLLLFGMSIAYLTWRRRTKEVKFPIIIVSCLLFAVSTIHFGFGFDNIIQAFIVRRDEPGGPPALIDEPSFALRIDVMFSTNNFLGDAVLVYRCWLVWGKDWRIIALPLAALITYTCSAIIGLYHLSLVGQSDAPQFTPSVASFGTASFSLSLALNFIVTGLIAARVYSALRGIDSTFLPTPHKRQYYSIIAMIVESGAIFCAGQIIFVTLWSIHSNAHWIGANPASQIYCIVPTLIILRVALGISSDQTTVVNTATQSKALSSRVMFSSRPPKLVSLPAGPSVSRVSHELNKDEILSNTYAMTERESFGHDKLSQRSQV